MLIGPINQRNHRAGGPVSCPPALVGIGPKLRRYSANFANFAKFPASNWQVRMRKSKSASPKSQVRIYKFEGFGSSFFSGLSESTLINELYLSFIDANMQLKQDDDASSSAVIRVILIMERPRLAHCNSLDMSAAPTEDVGQCVCVWTAKTSLGARGSRSDQRWATVVYGERWLSSID